MRLCNFVEVVCILSHTNQIVFEITHFGHYTVAFISAMQAYNHMRIIIAQKVPGTGMYGKVKQNMFGGRNNSNMEGKDKTTTLLVRCRQY